MSEGTVDTGGGTKNLGNWRPLTPPLRASSSFLRRSSKIAAKCVAVNRALIRIVEAMGAHKQTGGFGGVVRLGLGR